MAWRKSLTVTLTLTWRIQVTWESTVDIYTAYTIAGAIVGVYVEDAAIDAAVVPLSQSCRDSLILLILFFVLMNNDLLIIQIATFRPALGVMHGMRMYEDETHKQTGAFWRVNVGVVGRSYLVMCTFFTVARIMVSRRLRISIFEMFIGHVHKGEREKKSKGRIDC